MESSTPLSAAGAASQVADAPGRSSTHLAGALARLADLATRFGHEGVAQEARGALGPLEENLLRMVALGQFKRGKSTLLNALLEAPVLPTGVAPVTSVSTLVRWAPRARLKVRFETGEVEEAEGLERLSDFVVEARNPGNALGVRLVEVGYPAELLEDGLVLVDTPGIGSTDRMATERAYDFLPSVDAGLVVLSPDPPVGEAEADYVRELASLTPHLVFVLNKVDRVPEAEWREVLAFDRRVLGDLLERDPEDVDVIPVSARLALEDGGSSLAALRSHIDDFIRRKGARVREDLGRRRLASTGSRLRAHLEMERRGLDMEERELDVRLHGLRETVTSLEGRVARAARAVEAAVGEIVGRAGDAMLSEARTAREELAAALRDVIAQAEPTESNMSVATTFDDALAAGAWRVLDDWWEEHGAEAVEDLLAEMRRAGDDLAEARRDVSEWIREAFGVALPDEPRVEALKESASFYRHLEGATPRLTVDLLRALLPRPVYRAWLRRKAPGLAAQALEMGAGRVRGDMLYRARETARAFNAELRRWTVAGLDGLTEAAGRAAALRARTGRAAEERRVELEEALAELEALSRERRGWP